MDYDSEQSVLNNNNKRDIEMAREYCDEHEFYYKEHTCEPTWKDNGDLDMYVVTLHDSIKAKKEFVKKRNKKMKHKPKQYTKK